MQEVFSNLSPECQSALGSTQAIAEYKWCQGIFTKIPVEELYYDFYDNMPEYFEALGLSNSDNPSSNTKPIDCDNNKNDWLLNCYNQMSQAIYTGDLNFKNTSYNSLPEQCKAVLSTHSTSCEQKYCVATSATTNTATTNRKMDFSLGTYSDRCMIAEDLVSLVGLEICVNGFSEEVV